MQAIYCLSGLGADHRAFQKLDLPGYKLIFIKWVIPYKNESMSDYAVRLSSQIKEEKPILIGLSFGGMLAIEISKLIGTSIVFLISSAKNKSELHPGFSSMMRWNLTKLIPRPLLHKSNFITEYFFGVKSKEDKSILAEIIADTDLDFLFWALEVMNCWNNDYKPENLVDIHGTSDKIIPYRGLPDRNTILHGGHLMILDEATQISKIILSYLRP